jgi:hypothetical protein
MRPRTNGMASHRLASTSGATASINLPQVAYEHRSADTGLTATARNPLGSQSSSAVVVWVGLSQVSYLAAVLPPR